MRLIFAVLAALFTASAGLGDDARLTARNTDAITVANDAVALAGQPTQADLDTWAQEGYGVVVNMRSTAETEALPFDERAAVEARGMSYISIPMGRADGVDATMRQRLSAALAEADAPVVIHCRSGNRVAHAYAAHLIATGALERDDVDTVNWGRTLSQRTLDALLADIGED